jgi:membrane-associated phospholipid phosphatase
MENKNKKVLKWFSLNVIISICLLIAGVFVFALIADEAVLEHENRVDGIVFSFFDSITTPGLIKVMKVFTFLGSAPFLFPAYVILVVYFLIRKKFIYAIEIGIIGLSSQCLLYALKQIFHRQRPGASLIKNLTTYSFPSGHTFSSFIFCSILIYVVQHSKLKTNYKWIMSILLFLFALTISMSRVVLKVHYPTDVFASLGLALAWVVLLLWLSNKINLRRSGLFIAK